MSRIYFHSPSGDAELIGSERAHMGILCGKFLKASIGPISDYYPSMPHWLRELLPTDHWVVRSSNFAFRESCNLFMGEQSAKDGFVYNNQVLPMFNLALNTALFSGSDSVKLLARIHAQCEIHCYVTGENRQWIANIIKTGRLYNIMRAEQGWEDVVALLERRNNEPVVLSYSVCEEFPNMGHVPEDHPWQENTDAFYNADEKEKWEVCWKHLYETKPDLELRPDNWNKFYFGNGLSGFDLQKLAEGKYGQTSLEDLFQERNQPLIMRRAND